MKRNDQPKEWTDAEVQLLLELSREGAGVVQIASALDRYISSVKRVAQNFGLQLRG
jgi:predicted transcriptional regulator